jgi:WD40 repeat protein
MYSVVCCVRFSADGKYLATGCNRTAQIYDTKTGQKTWCVHLIWAMEAVFTPDSSAYLSMRRLEKQAIYTSEASASALMANT